MAYVEDLIAEQLRRGHQVAYFFSGRQYPLGRTPGLKRWERDGVKMLEVVNSPLLDHGRQPGSELSEPALERLFAQALTELEPELVHVQELAGLPSSVLDLSRQAGIPTVFTLQDYFPLCSTFKLLDADGRICLRREIGADCVATVAADSRAPGLLVEATVDHDLSRVPGLRRPAPRRLVRGVARTAGSLEARRRLGAQPPRGTAAEYQRRREVNLERLNRTDRLVAMSRRVSEIYVLLGVEPDRLRTMQLTLGHIARLNPRPEPTGTPRRLMFASLAAFESPAKGGRLLIEAVRALRRRGLSDKFRVLIFGHVDPRLHAAAIDLPEFEVRGQFAPERLDGLLDEVDVGILPSIWEEAYGYAGVEFLAKGIPVIANDRGGMPEYVHPGRTGWLNRSVSAEELAEIMATAVLDPAQVSALSQTINASRRSLIKTMSEHQAELDAVYEELLRAGR